MAVQNIIAHSFTQLLTVDSTNTYARKLLENGQAQNGQVIFAHEQTEGKGQREKKWLSPNEESLSMTIILESETIYPSTPFFLSASIALACINCLKQIAKIQCSIKWPNDVYAGHKKIGGILIEQVKKDGKAFNIIGIGININQAQFDTSLPNPTSLFLETGKITSPLLICKGICPILNAYWHEIKAGKTLKIFNEYHEHLYQIGKEIQFKRNGELITAILKGVTDKGQLLVFHQYEELINHGSIEWIIPTGSDT